MKDRLTYAYLRQQRTDLLREAALQIWPDRVQEIKVAEHNELCYSISLVTDKLKDIRNVK